MPTTRRSAANARGRTGPTRGQSIINFSNKVTKDLPKHTKRQVRSPARAEVQDPEEARPSETGTPAASQDISTASQDTSAASQDVYQAKSTRDEVASAGEIGHTIQKLDIRQNTNAPAKDQSWEQTELAAENIPDSQIRDYWSAIERHRKAPMVHLEGVDVWEKALRHFDVSSQYGPCIGIPRSKRWRRAQRLGLDPPIEILAIIQKEAKLGRRDTQTAQMDRIMNATALAT